jgi:hypothetical protein
MHESTFEYLKPTELQMKQMNSARGAAKDYADAIEELVPPGVDRDHIMRQLRTVAMWVNVAITRMPDGSPR